NPSLCSEPPTGRYFRLLRPRCTLAPRGRPANDGVVQAAHRSPVGLAATVPWIAICVLDLPGCRSPRRFVDGAMDYSSRTAGSDRSQLDKVCRHSTCTPWGGLDSHALCFGDDAHANEGEHASRPTTTRWMPSSHAGKRDP